MTVFVDNMFQYPMGQFKTRSGRVYKMSHMIATTESELHRMARRIGVERRWFQDKLSGPHYDIAMSKRKLAVEYGAVEVTMRELASILWCLRNELEYATPADAYTQMLDSVGLRSKRQQNGTTTHRAKTKTTKSL